MNTWTDYLLLRDPNAAWVLGGVCLLSISAGLTGVFSYLRGQSLIGDAISHALLPGVCLAFLFSSGMHPGWLLLGAAASGAAGLWAIDQLGSVPRMRPDTALALVLSVFYGLGVLLLTAIQGSGMERQAGLDRFLFGKAASIGLEEMQVLGGAALLATTLLWAFFRPLCLLAFDEPFMQTLGWRVDRMKTLLSFLNILVIALGIQSVGVVLMAALLIGPAAAARYWTHRMPVMMALAALFAALAALVGVTVSFAAPRMPTGPWVVVALTVIALGSAALGKERGWLAARRRSVRNQEKMARENLLKALYQLGEARPDVNGSYNMNELADFREMAPERLRRGLRQLATTGLITSDGATVSLTAEGRKAGAQITRLHRLWELYLTSVVGLPPDHVHDDAEAMEHVITPELEAELARRLNFPQKDPHASPIPSPSETE